MGQLTLDFTSPQHVAEGYDVYHRNHATCRDFIETTKHMRWSEDTTEVMGGLTKVSIKVEYIPAFLAMVRLSGIDYCFSNGSIHKEKS